MVVIPRRLDLMFLPSETGNTCRFRLRMVKCFIGFYRLCRVDSKIADTALLKTISLSSQERIFFEIMCFILAMRFI